MRVLPTAFLVAMMALRSSPVVALSCVEYDIRDAFWRYVNARETFVLAFGGFLALRDRHDDPVNDQVLWRTTFVGATASTRGFDQPFSAVVTITDHLFTGIAGGEVSPDGLANGLPGLEGLVFLRKTASGYAIETALCVPIIDTDPASVRRAVDCQNRRRCPRPG